MKVRLVIITQNGSPIVEPLCSYQQFAKVVGIVESAPRGSATIAPQPPPVYIVMLKRLLGASEPLISCAQRLHTPYFYLHKNNEDEFIAWLNEVNCDLIMIYSMSHLIGQRVISTPRFGVLNLHPSLLPAYRGPDPWFWMYYNYDEFGGVTLHYVDSGEDTGDIVFQRRYPIPRGARTTELKELVIENHGKDMLFEALKYLAEGKSLPRTPQTPRSSTPRARRLKPNEHKTIIDWQNWPIERVWHVMRGTEEWLDCIDPPTGIYAGFRWRVLEYDKHKVDDRYAIGILYRERGMYRISCRDGSIHVRVNINWRSLPGKIYRRINVKP